MAHLDSLALVCFDLLVEDLGDARLLDGLDSAYAEMDDDERSEYLHEQANRCAVALLDLIRDGLQPQLETVEEWRRRTDRTN